MGGRHENPTAQPLAAGDSGLRRDFISKSAARHARPRLLSLFTLVPKALSSPRKKFITNVERALKRSLSVEEMQAVRRFDDFVVETAVKDFNAGQMVTMLNEASGVHSPVGLLQSLAESPVQLTEARETLINFHKGRAKRCVAAFDFGLALEQFTKWFFDLLRADPPPPGMRALRFGLFESRGACRIYVSGTRANDIDWTRSGDWWNNNHVMPDHLLLPIWRDLKRSGAEPWVAAQAIIIVFVKAFFSKHAVEFQEISGLRRVHVVSGFDDGDLYELRTTISSGA